MAQRIAVIGGGASGLMAAVFAAKGGGEVTILESGPRLGRKLLATGNGRCNLTNQSICAEHYHGDVQELETVLERYPSRKIIQVFEGFGLLCRVEEQGRVYPYNVQSSAVLDILRLQLAQYPVAVRCGFPVTDLQKAAGIFRISSTNGETVCADKVILATGGKASPRLGSDGSGFPLVKQLGHSVTPLVPALVGIQTPSHRARPLKGMRSYGTASFWLDGQKIREETGEVQFTEYGLSGICIFQLSRHIHRALEESPRAQAEVSLDLMPEYTEEWLAKKIAGHAKQYPGLALSELLWGLLNKRVGEEIVRQVFDKPHTMQAAQCRFADAQELARQIKQFSFPIPGMVSWENAQVTAGGVAGKEVNPQTMESNCCPGLYLAGEVLNLDGDCGGFNLHWAWASGMLAGLSAAGTSSQKKKFQQGGNPL